MSLATARANARPGGAAAVERLMRPRSVAIVGISSKPGCAGHTALANLTVNKYAGDIYLVGRSGGKSRAARFCSVCRRTAGRRRSCGIYAAGGRRERSVGGLRAAQGAAVVVFASGFAEFGNREAQEEIAKIARDGGIAMLGPNCLGYTNFVDGLQIGFASAQPVPKRASTGAPALAIISQSGGFMAHLRQAFDGRNLPMSYTVSPGNEGGLDLVDFVEFLTTDKIHQGDRALRRAHPPSGGISRRGEGGARRRQAGHHDASGPRRSRRSRRRVRTPARLPETTM